MSLISSSLMRVVCLHLESELMRFSQCRSYGLYHSARFSFIAEHQKHSFLMLGIKLTSFGVIFLISTET